MIPRRVAAQRSFAPTPRDPTTSRQAPQSNTMSTGQQLTLRSLWLFTVSMLASQAFLLAHAFCPVPARTTRCLSHSPSVKESLQRVRDPRLDLMAVQDGIQLQTVLEQAGDAGVYVILYYTELHYSFENAEMERTAQKFAEAPEALFIQLTRDELMQAVICSSRGIVAFPTTQIWRDGQKLVELTGLSGVARVTEVLASYGIFPPTSDDGFTNAAGARGGESTTTQRFIPGFSGEQSDSSGPKSSPWSQW